jgi:AcrR family transcriptional regulator
MSSRKTAAEKPKRKAPKRRTQPTPKRIRTREKLVEVAAGLFLKKGISAVSLDEVAAKAGVTKGAIYGNFENKDDLVFAVAMEKLTRPRPVFTEVGSLDEQLRALVRDTYARSPATRQHLAFLVELDFYMLKNDRLQRLLLASAKERYAKSAANLAAIHKRSKLPLPELPFTIVIHALFNGLMFQRAIFPEIVTEEVVLKALESMID